MPAQTYLTLAVSSNPIQLAYDFISVLSNKTPVMGNETMCFGEREMPDTPLLKLFGTIGPRKYHPIWDFVVEDFIGVVILIDDTDAESTTHALEKLAIFREHTAPPPIVVAIRQSSSEHTKRVINKLSGLLDDDHILIYDPDTPDDVKRIATYVAKLKLGDQP